jgi:hypothetical protein
MRCKGPPLPAYQHAHVRDALTAIRSSVEQTRRGTRQIEPTTSGGRGGSI